MVALYRRHFEHYGHGTADQAIVGLGGQVFMRRNSQDAVNKFRPYSTTPGLRPRPSLEDFTTQTPLTVGSPQQVLERTLGFREYAGDYRASCSSWTTPGCPSRRSSSSSTCSARIPARRCVAGSPRAGTATYQTPRPTRPWPP